MFQPAFYYVNNVIYTLKLQHKTWSKTQKIGQSIMFDLYDLGFLYLWKLHAKIIKPYKPYINMADCDILWPILIVLQMRTIVHLTLSAHVKHNPF